METISKIFGVHSPKIVKSKAAPVACAFPELIAGVELETENASVDQYAYIGYSDERNHFWTVTRDGSLRGGDTAYEFISQPCQIQYLIPELEQFFKFAKFNENNYSDRCSVHVHTNVTDFTQDELSALALVYTVVEETLFQYVNFYKSPTKEGYNRDTNLYCIPWNQCRLNHRLIDGIFNPSKKPLSKWQKYTALNLLPILDRGSVEWRHMHGTADMEKLTGWLNIIGSIVHYSKRTPLDHIIKTIKELNDTSAYRQFFTDVLRDYIKYDDGYAATISEGVINAKYTLMDWDRTKIEKLDGKPVKAKKSITGILGEFNPDEALVAQWRTEADQQIRGLRPRPAPVNPVGHGQPLPAAPRGFITEQERAEMARQIAENQERNAQWRERARVEVTNGWTLDDLEGNR